MDATRINFSFGEISESMPPLPNVEGIPLPGYEKPYHQPLTDPSRVSSRNAERVNHLLSVLPQTQEVSTLLDLGAGNSEITNEISKTYSTITAYACDVYPTSEFVQPNSESTLIYKEIQNEIIPVENDSVDLVTAFMSIHHFNKLDDFIKEIRRILRPGKWFFFREHDVTTMKQIHQLNRVHERYAAKNAVNKRYHMVGRTRYWARKELQKFLEERGFNYVASSEYEKDKNAQAIYHSLFKLNK